MAKQMEINWRNDDALEEYPRRQKEQKQRQKELKEQKRKEKEMQAEQQPPQKITQKVQGGKRKRTKNNCQFMLLAMETTKHRYHVYKHGEHNHRPITPRRSNFLFYF